MVERMRFINLMGPCQFFNFIATNYVFKYDIHIEDAMQELNNVPTVEPFDDASMHLHFTQIAKRFKRLAALSDEYGPPQAFEEDEAFSFLKGLSEEHEKSILEIELLKDEINNLEKTRNLLKHYAKLDIPFDELYKFESICFKFGRFSRLSYNQVKDQIRNEDVIYIKTSTDDDYVYLVYFTKRSTKNKIDMLFNTVHFEEIVFNETLNATPANCYDNMCSEIELRQQRIALIEDDIRHNIYKHRDSILKACNTIKTLDDCYRLRKSAVKTDDDYFILCGWMPEKEAYKLDEEIQKEKSLIFIFEEETNELKSTPPTKLRNLRFIKPFELLVSMYGLPSYGEVDPTPFVAIVYTFLFGMMFGDVGQGLIICCIGLLMSQSKKIEFGTVLTTIGLSSVVFGFLFGSNFGEEFHPVWFTPMHEINPKLNIYNILIIAIGIGIFLILVSMLFNIFNCIKQKRFGDALFDVNGVSGLVFYTTTIGFVYTSIYGYTYIDGMPLTAMLIVPLMCMAFKVPLTGFVERRKIRIHGTMGNFVLETFFELLEVLLSYMANTISFVRVGAFVLSHAGMMSVVLLLSQGDSAPKSVAVMLLGNAIVVGFEGLIVGIQVLRLHYYEMFSRFYKGAGRKFISCKMN